MFDGVDKYFPALGPVLFHDDSILWCYLPKLVNETGMLYDDRNDEEMNDKNCFVLVYEKLTMLRRLPFRRLHKIPISLKCI